MPVVISWDETNAEQRALLSRPVAILRRRRAISWRDVFLEAFGPRNRVGSGYQDNLSRGRIAPERAFMLQSWIERHDPVLAAEVEKAVLEYHGDGAVSRGDSWNRYIKRKGVFERVIAFAYKPTLGISEFAFGEPLPGLSIELGREYYFEITADRDGVLACLLRHKARWYAIPLSRFNLFTPCQEGKNLVPSTTDEAGIDPLVEREDQGLHEFAFFHASLAHQLAPLGSWSGRKPIPPSALDDAAAHLQTVPEGEISILRINLLVT